MIARSFFHGICQIIGLMCVSWKAVDKKITARLKTLKMKVILRLQRRVDISDGVSDDCFLEGLEPDPLDGRAQALGILAVRTVERNDLFRKHHGLRFRQPFRDDHADLRGAAAFAAGDRCEPVISAEEPRVLEPGVAAAVGASGDAHLELGRRGGQ